LVVLYGRFVRNLPFIFSVQFIDLHFLIHSGNFSCKKLSIWNQLY